VVQLRDNSFGMPAAVVLLSPWSDLTDRGETMHTLANADSILIYDNMLLNSALAYAHGLNLDDPRISPLYADFRKGFPPTLIIEGTRCEFLSSSVRLYQALDQARQEVKLDLYEGMWHGFLAAPILETSIALNKIDMFIKARYK
jgi:acetyl esterase/lipase